MENVEIAHVLDEISTLLEIQGANPFRIRAYHNAARIVEAHSVPLRKLVETEEDLTALPAIGKDIAALIGELVTTGKLTLMEQLTTEIPSSLIELVKLPGIGAKRVRLMWEALKITTIDELERAAQAGQIADLKGLGAKTQEKILKAIESHRRRTGRTRLVDADQFVRPLLEHLRGEPAVLRVEVAGSYRRRAATVGDIDILVEATDSAAVMDRFTRSPTVRNVELAGDTKGTVHLAGGLRVDLRVVPPESYGAALQYFTGSKEHNVKLRTWAVNRGLRVSEYGVFSIAGDGEEEYLAGRDEADVYRALELSWIPAELREDRGELEAARAGQLPQLVTTDAIRGDLQMHSTWSDGKGSIEDMTEGCIARGYEYFALTDHSKALAMTGGLDAERLREQWLEIDEVRDRHPEIRILRSMEVDILVDGTLDLDDESLAELDVVVASIHSRFDLPAAEQTERILRALAHPLVHILAHPTGRLLNRRDPLAFDIDAVLQAAAEHGVAVELNAHPARLDLPDIHLMRAKELGVPIVISTDAHRVQDLELMSYGIEQARRGWLEASDILNTLPLGEMLATLRGP